jgi:hypothetical protein
MGYGSGCIGYTECRADDYISSVPGCISLCEPVPCTYCLLILSRAVVGKQWHANMPGANIYIYVINYAVYILPKQVDTLRCAFTIHEFVYIACLQAASLSSALMQVVYLLMTILVRSSLLTTFHTTTY